MYDLETAQMKPMTSAQIADAWTQYSNTGDHVLREQLILEHASLVKYVVNRLAASLPPSLEYEDLISHGIVGLIQAVDRFDPSRGVPFQAYATPRIKGEILDALRRLDLVPRSARQRAREIQRAISKLQGRLGRNPTDEELADHLDTTTEEIEKRLQETTFVLISLDAPLFGSHSEGLPLGELLEDEESPTPTEHMDELDIRERLREALQELAERERQVLSLYHEQGLTMKEVGRVLGVSESRISQIYSKTVLTLRASMQEQSAPTARQTLE